jgi:beta-galactosidase
LKYATTQPIGRIVKGNEQYVFLMQIPGMETELAFDISTVKEIVAKGFKKETVGNIIYLNPETGSQIKITAANGQLSTIVLLNRQEAEDCWRSNINGQESMIITGADLMVSKDKIEFRQLGNPSFEFKIFPELNKSVSVAAKVIIPEKTSVFNFYKVRVPFEESKVTISKNSKMESVVTMPETLPKNLSDIFLEIDYLGGEAEASMNNQKLTDHLFCGTPWVFGVKRYIDLKKKIEIKFRIKVWNEQITGVSDQLQKQIKESGSQIKSIKVMPQYKMVVNFQNQ